MNIPSQIKVGARVYNIIEVDECAGIQSDTVGQTDFRAHRIKLLQLESRQEMEQSLLHEIMHAIAYDMGHIDHDEREIELLANELHRLIVDNPELFGPEAQPTRRETHD